jgi:transcriptional antiterminator NusG
MNDTKEPQEDLEQEPMQSDLEGETPQTSPAGSLDSDLEARSEQNAIPKNLRNQRTEEHEEKGQHSQVVPSLDPEPFEKATVGCPDGENLPTPSGEAGAEPAWLLFTASRYENKVRHNLEQRIETMGMKDKIFDVVIPTQDEIEVKDGKRRTVERHIFPGYVLVNLILTEESWYVVRNTPGVTGFVGMGNQPTPLRPEEVSQIIKRMEAEAPTVKVTFKVGERVRIIDGPFNDFRGMVSRSIWNAPRSARCHSLGVKRPLSWISSGRESLNSNKPRLGGSGSSPLIRGRTSLNRPLKPLRSKNGKEI